jgi:hypothetical protein
MSATWLLGTSAPQFLDYQLCTASRLPPHGIYFDQCRLAESGHRYSRRIILSHQSGLVEMAGLAAFLRRRTLLKEEAS